MSDDIVTRLRQAGTVNWGHYSAPSLSGLLADAADEIERLRRWKAEATAVIEEWEAVWESAGKPSLLGQSKPIGLMAELGRLADEIERLRSVLVALAEQDASLDELIYPNDEWLSAYTHAVTIGKEARRG